MANLNTTSNDHGESQFKPNTTVAAVIEANGTFLLVEEIENGKTVYNQPAGHLEAHENLLVACQREVQEETGLSLTPSHLSGIYYFHRPEMSLYFLRFCFAIKLDSQQKCQPQDDDILACHWFTYEEIVDKKQQLRSPMVLECIDDYLAGKQIPVEFLRSNI